LARKHTARFDCFGSEFGKEETLTVCKLLVSW